MKKIEIGKLTKEQVAALKDEHNISEVFEVSVQSKKGELHYGYFRPPTRAALGAAQMAGASGNKISYMEALANECHLAGSQILLSDDYLFLGLSSVLLEIYELADAKIAKL